MTNSILKKTQTLFDKSNIKQTLLNTAFILFLVSLLHKFIMQILLTHSFESWRGSEWLINYQGGFVRRGLIGEILFFFAKNFNINIEWTIKIFCLLCFAAVSVFFVRAFLKKGYSLYILPLCFFLGTHIADGMYWHKRDYAMFVFLIAIFFTFNKIDKRFVKFIIINVLVIIALQVHEVFALFSFPFLFLLFFNEYRNKGIFQSVILSIISLVPGICAFLLTLKYHGNYETAQMIWDSWVAVANLNAAEITTYSHGALSAIGWESDWTFRMHFEYNFLSRDMLVSSTVFWSVTIPLVYYIATNALLVFRKKEDIFTHRDKTTLSSVLIFQLICLTPMFLVLSCDLGRIIFYWVASSFVIFLLIPKEKIENLFPSFYIRFIKLINNGLTNILHPTKTTLALLMMFIGIPTVGFSLFGVIESGMLYNVLRIISIILVELKMNEILIALFDFFINLF
jgi:hypothetical protein